MTQAIGAPQPTDEESHYTAEESATFNLAFDAVDTLPEPGRKHTKAEPNHLNVYTYAVKELLGAAASDAMKTRTAADHENAKALGGGFALAEPTYQALKQDVQSAGELLESTSFGDDSSPMFQQIADKIEREWPDNFHEASQMFLLSKINECEQIVTTHARVDAIDRMEVGETIQSMVDAFMSAVCKVHASLPESSTRGAEFPFDAEVKAKLDDIDQQIADMATADQHDAVLELQRQKRDMLADSLTDMNEMVNDHSRSIDNVCEARAATMDSVGEDLRQALSTLELKLKAFQAEVEAQTRGINTRQQNLKAVHRSNTEKSAVAAAAQAQISGSASTEQAVLLSGKTGANFMTTVVQLTTAAKRQAEATAAARKIEETMGGYDSAMETLYESCGDLQNKQADVLTTIASTLGGLSDLSSIFTNAAAALVDTSAGWEKLVNQSLVRVRTTKHELVTRYYRWTTTYTLTPAMKAEAKAKVQVQVTKAAEADERECVDLDDPSALKDAVTDAKKAVAKHAKATERVTVAKAELEDIVTTYDYKHLRVQLVDAGVCIGSDPSEEDGPDVSGYIRGSIARLQSMLALGF